MILTADHAPLDAILCGLELHLHHALMPKMARQELH